MNKKIFKSNFITQRGGISLSPGESTKPLSVTTYESDATYQLFFTLSNYIPIGGVLTVLLPSEIEITEDGNPYDALTADEEKNFIPVANGWGTTDVFDVTIGKNVKLHYINYKITVKVEAGAYTLTFGGARNPRSFDATGVFQIKSTDGTE